MRDTLKLVKDSAAKMTLSFSLDQSFVSLFETSLNELNEKPGIL